MYATARHDGDDDDQHVVLRQMTWRDFERLLAIRGDRAGVRMYYLDGEIEFMSPGRAHEGRKKRLAGLLEMWALERGPEFDGFGSWTLKNEVKEAGAEPDECYVFGDVRGKDVPDLAIEIEWSRKGITKHLIYARLGVRELWTLRPDGRIVIRVLSKGKYVERAKSSVLPRLDVAWLLGFLDIEPQSRAVRALRDEMRKERRRL